MTGRYSNVSPSAEIDTNLVAIIRKVLESKGIRIFNSDDLMISMSAWNYANKTRNPQKVANIIISLTNLAHICYFFRRVRDRLLGN